MSNLWAHHNLPWEMGKRCMVMPKHGCSVVSMESQQMVDTWQKSMSALNAKSNKWLTCGTSKVITPQILVKGDDAVPIPDFSKCWGERLPSSIKCSDWVKRNWGTTCPLTRPRRYMGRCSRNYNCGGSSTCTTCLLSIGSAHMWGEKASVSEFGKYNVFLMVNWLKRVRVSTIE